jgi:hypothetical protein
MRRTWSSTNLMTTAKITTDSPADKRARIFVLTGHVGISVSD